VCLALAAVVPATVPAAGLDLEIYEIQGSGVHSPYVDTAVETNDNVVTAVRDDGFFLQTPETVIR
jgi:predicted extracellular nuclease